MNDTIKSIAVLLITVVVAWVALVSLKQFFVGDIIKLLKEIKDLLEEKP